MRSLWCAFLFVLVACQGVDANCKDPNDPNELSRAKCDATVEEPNDPNELLRVKWDAIISILRNKDLDATTKEKQIGEIVTPFFDFPLMAKLALGRTHWPKFTQPQSEQFTRLFAELLKTSYLAKVSLYKDETVLFKPAVRKNKVIYIPTELVHKDKKVAILYKFRKVDPAPIEDEKRAGCLPEQEAAERPSQSRSDSARLVRGWKIYDVEIQGVSILLTYRSQFDEILRRDTVEDLLSRLEKPTDD